jgi:thiol:disulfide interchange protein DsbC
MLLGAQLVYVSMDGKYLVDGQVIEMASRRNLTEAAKGEVRRKRLDAVTSDMRVIYPATSDLRHKVTIFTDIDCGYCRKLHQEMAQYNELGIEIDYLFFPRAGIPSNSYDKAVSVWCSGDRNAALTDAKAGNDPAPMDCANPVEQHFELGRELGVTGTPAVLTEDGTLIPGYVPPATLLARLEAMAASR